MVTYLRVGNPHIHIAISSAVNASISFTCERVLLPVMCPSVGMGVKMLFLSLQVLTGIAVCLSEDKVKRALIKHKAEEIISSMSGLTPGLAVNERGLCCSVVVVELAVALLATVCCGERSVGGCMAMGERPVSVCTREEGLGGSAARGEGLNASVLCMSRRVRVAGEVRGCTHALVCRRRRNCELPRDPSSGPSHPSNSSSLSDSFPMSAIRKSGSVRDL